MWAAILLGIKFIMRPSGKRQTTELRGMPALGFRPQHFKNSLIFSSVKGTHSLTSARMALVIRTIMQEFGSRNVVRPGLLDLIWPRRCSSQYMTQLSLSATSWRFWTGTLWLAATDTMRYGSMYQMRLLYVKRIDPETMKGRTHGSFIRAMSFFFTNISSSTWFSSRLVVLCQ